MVEILRLPGLRMMSHNRLVFVGSLAILALTSVGLDALLRGEVSRRRWFLLPATLLAALAAWCFFRVGHLPELVAASQHGIQLWFIRGLPISGILCAIGVAGWILLSTDHGLRPWKLLCWGSYSSEIYSGLRMIEVTQADPALYYPRIPVLEQIAQSSPGRIIGYNCLPAALAQTHELRDVRGYDSVDPGRLTTLLYLAANLISSPILQRYAVTQWLRTAGSSFLRMESNFHRSWTCSVCVMLFFEVDRKPLRPRLSRATITGRSLIRQRSPEHSSLAASRR